MRREVEVDTQLAALWEQEQDANGKLAASLLYLQHAVGDKVPNARWGYKYRDPRQFTTTNAEAEARAREQAAAGTLSMQHRGAVTTTLAAMDGHRLIAATAREAARPLELEYAAKRWPRFFLVTNTNGHVHSSMSCSTCRPTTLFSWQPSLSGLTEADAVAALGPKLCSVCYPSAPTEWLGKGRGA